jgi:uncharacterized Zn finger protein
LRVEVDAVYFERLGGLRILARVRSGSELYGVYMLVKGGRVLVARCTCSDHLVFGECEHVRMVYRLVLEGLGLGWPATLEHSN